MNATLFTRASRVVACSAAAARIPATRVLLRRQNISVRHSSAVAAEAVEHVEAEIEDSTPSAAFGVRPLHARKAPSAVEADQPEFETLKGRVSEDTLRAITGKPMGKLRYMSAVQAAVFPLLPELAEPYSGEPLADDQKPPARDLLVKARTGTGKTLGFLVPAIESRLKAIDLAVEKGLKDAGVESDIHLAAQLKRTFTHTTVGTLIISPTRELATQIANEALKATHFQKGFEVRLFVGGESKRAQMRDWMRGRRDIVVATPGRLRDLLESEPDVARSIKTAKMLVLDEADTLLDMGFRDDIDAITAHLPPTPQRQTFLFSATVSRSIQQIARATLDKNHLFVNCVSDDAPPVHAHVPQYGTVLPNAGAQIPHLLNLLAHDQLSNPGKSKTIVFFPTTKMTQLFSTLLREIGKKALPSGAHTKVYELHSKRPQESRSRTADAFRKDTSGASVLVTSDVSARGVDYPGVTRVVQVGIPMGTDVYVHRVGRTGRGGATNGRGDLVLLPWEMGFITWQLTSIPIKPLNTDDLIDEVKELAAKYDQDPESFFKNVKTEDYKGRQLPDGPRQFRAPYTPIHAEMGTAVQNLLAQVDEDAIAETMGAMLGYYISKAPELRVQKDVIVEGCKTWTTEACGLPTPPYISQAFLQKLGYSDGRTKPRSTGYLGRKPRGDSKPWEGRGRQSSSSFREREQGEGSEGRSQERASWGSEGQSQERGARSSWGEDRAPRKKWSFEDQAAEYKTPRYRY